MMKDVKARASDQKPDTIPDTSGIQSAREAADRLGVHERTIRRAISRGDLVAARHGRAYHMTDEALSVYGRERDARALRSSSTIPRTHGVTPAQDTAWSLPQFLTSFLGREPEMAFLQMRLLSAETRLLTVTGPGGVGRRA